MPDEHHKNQHPVNWGLVVIITLCAILFAAIAWFGSDVFSLYRNGVRIHRRFFSRTTPKPAQIEGWMTFRYVNFVFNLPASYLAARLNITDPAYPNITLSKYASMQKLNTLVFVQSVRDTVATSLGGESP